MEPNTVCIPIDVYNEMKECFNLFRQGGKYYKVDFDFNNQSYLAIEKDEYITALTNELYALKKELASLNKKPRLPWYKRLFN